VSNPCDADRPRDGGTGLGLGNVRGRLEALFGNRANVVARDDRDPSTSKSSCRRAPPRHRVREYLPCAC
jgi:hypothetical protein